MRYRKLGLPIPGSFYEKQQEPYVDNNNFDYPPVTGGEFGRDILLASPGGLASTAHHWTGGFYGKGGSSTDKFIGKNSNPYLSGEYGNLYSTKEFEDLDDTFEILPYKKAIEFDNDDSLTGENDFSKKAKSKNKKGFGADKTKSSGRAVTLLWAVGFAFLLVAIYFVLSLWNTTGILYLKETFNSGMDFSPKTYLFMSVFGTVFLVLMCWILGVSFVAVLQEAAS